MKNSRASGIAAKGICLAAIFIFSMQLLSGCSGFQGRMTARLMRPTLNEVVTATYSCESMLVPQYGLPGSLLILEGLIEGAPRDDFLLELAAQSYYGFSMGYVEEADRVEASTLYLTGRNHALTGLWGENAVSMAEDTSLDEFSALVGDIDKSKVGLLFWSGNCWGSWLFLNLHDPDAVANLSRVQILMERALYLDETYFYGGPHLFFGAFYGSRSPFFGGDHEKSRFHFEKCLEISGGGMLLTRVFYAKYLAVQSLDVELFREQLGIVLEADNNILPGMEFINILAKKQARALLEKEEDLF